MYLSRSHGHLYRPKHTEIQGENNVHLRASEAFAAFVGGEKELLDSPMMRTESKPVEILSLFGVSTRIVAIDYQSIDELTSRGF